MADPLKTYRDKRDFDVTPEPGGDAPLADGGRSFCVQKHAATRLHFDLRLELGGVLKCWAVTRGPSLDPAQKRLAVRTEDHPVGYGDFEGTIPAGAYGAGTMMLWDRGVWTPEEADPDATLAGGEVKFTLEGERLTGRWTLVRMNTEGKRENWLLIKKRDAAAEDGGEPTKAHTTSVKTGRTLGEIAEGAPSKAKAKAGGKAKADAKGAKRTGARPTFEKPVLCRLTGDVPGGEGWIHEMKYDGYRLLAAVGGGDARLWTRNEKDWTQKLPGLAEALKGLDCQSALIDGEAAVLNESGLTDFSALQAAFKGEGETEITYFAFDLLKLDGEDLRGLPLIERKARLSRLLSGQSGVLRYADHVSADGAAMYAAACDAGAEGIISKKAASTYRAGRDGRWRKIKCERRQEAVIVGWSPSQKAGRAFASLLLATCKDGDWVYRGRVGTGFDAAEIAAIARALLKIERKTPPLAGVPRDIAREARWVTPTLVAEIRYTERTRDGVLRHPAFLGLRGDKAAGDVHGEPDLP